MMLAVVNCSLPPCCHVEQIHNLGCAEYHREFEAYGRSILTLPRRKPGCTAGLYQMSALETLIDTSRKEPIFKYKQCYLMSKRKAIFTVFNV